jgi:hypothetical protein
MGLCARGRRNRRADSQGRMDHLDWSRLGANRCGEVNRTALAGRKRRSPLIVSFLLLLSSRPCYGAGAGSSNRPASQLFARCTSRAGTFAPIVDHDASVEPPRSHGGVVRAVAFLAGKCRDRMPQFGPSPGCEGRPDHMPASFRPSPPRRKGAELHVDVVRAVAALRHHPIDVLARRRFSAGTTASHALASGTTAGITCRRSSGQRLPAKKGRERIRA